MQRFGDRYAGGGHKVTISSCYRSPAYNKKIGGAKDSQHMKLTATDIVVHGAGGPSDWRRELRAMRAEGLFKGGIGLYKTFVHVDVRGWNADW